MSLSSRRCSLAFLTAISIALNLQYNGAAAAAQPRAGTPAFGALAPTFVRNIGEADPAARFYAVGGGRPIFLTAGDLRIVDPGRRTSLWLTFVDGAATEVDGESPTGGAVSYMGRGPGAQRQ